MTEKGDRFIKDMDGTLIPSDYKTIGTVNSMLWRSVNENTKRYNYFETLKSTAKGDPTLFTSFLPFRFRIKKILNNIGAFEIYQKLKRKSVRLKDI